MSACAGRRDRPRACPPVPVRAPVLIRATGFDPRPVSIPDAHRSRRASAGAGPPTTGTPPSWHPPHSPHEPHPPRRPALRAPATGPGRTAVRPRSGHRPAGVRRRRVILAGLDVGSTHCKALLCAQDGTVLAQAQRRTPAADHTVDVARLQAAALDALAECTAATGRAPDAIGVTGMAETGAPRHRRGALLPALAWSDPRPAAHADRLRRDHGAAALHAATGILPSPRCRWPSGSGCARSTRTGCAACVPGPGPRTSSPRR
ncbi:FGGY family carbohydrate kinase [Streptomyces sp. M19]